MKKIIICIFFLTISCKDKIELIEREVPYSTLIEPRENIYVELLSYYPAINKNQSNYYHVRDTHSKDTLFVIDKDSLPIADFIKSYNGVENTNLILRKGNMNNKKTYIINIPLADSSENKRFYLGEIIRLDE